MFPMQSYYFFKAIYSIDTFLQLKLSLRKVYNTFSLSTTFILKSLQNFFCHNFFLFLFAFQFPLLSHKLAQAALKYFSLSSDSGFAKTKL